MGGRASQESIVPDEEVVFFARNAVILHICLCFNRLYGPPRLLELEVLWWGSRGGLVQGWRNRGPGSGHRSARDPPRKPSNHSIGKCGDRVLLSKGLEINDLCSSLREKVPSWAEGGLIIKNS